MGMEHPQEQWTRRGGGGTEGQYVCGNVYRHGMLCDDTNADGQPC